MMPATRVAVWRPWLLVILLYLCFCYLESVLVCYSRVCLLPSFLGFSCCRLVSGLASSYYFFVI